MKRLLIAVLLITGLLPSFAHAQQGESSPTIYLYLQFSDHRSPPDDDADLVPVWLEAYLTEILAGLTEVGEIPLIVTPAPERLLMDEALQAIIAPTRDLDEVIFAEPPFRALSISVQRYNIADTLFVSPFSPFPYEPLPMGNFGWVPFVNVSDETPPSYAAPLATGLALYTVNSCEAAISYFAQIREAAAFNEEDLFVYSAIRFYEANCRYSLGEVDAAAPLFEQILAYAHEHDEENDYFDVRWYSDASAINLAAVYLQNDQTAKSLALLDDYSNIDTENYDISEREFGRFFARADLYLALDEPDKALAEINQLIAVHEADTFVSSLDVTSQAWLYTERGYRYQQIGDETAALADYELSIEIDPTYPVAYYRRGLLLSGDEARQDLETFLELAPDFNSLHHPSLDPLIEDAEMRLE